MTRHGISKAPASAASYCCPTPKCDGSIQDLVFVEPMVHHQRINPECGEIMANIEASDAEVPYFICESCGTVIYEGESPEHFQDLFSEWLHASKTLKRDFMARRQKEKEARQKKAWKRQQERLEALREEYRNETGFLPPIAKAKKPKG